MKKYLFIRILEACNAACTMCPYALSKEPYRFGAGELRRLVPSMRAHGIEFVRFTGGEPLMHKELSEMVSICADEGFRPSVITNGALLFKRIQELADAGLEQVVLSIDGPGEVHDGIRGVPGLFHRCMEGVRAAKRLDLLVRVNTVCGPNNFRAMPALQRQLSALRVDQWELSSLKLEKPLDWSDADVASIDGVVEEVYVQAKSAGLLVPLGKIWCGETPEERSRYLLEGVTPRADESCHVVDYVRYLDPKAGELFSCSLMGHRPGSEKYAVSVDLSQPFPELSSDRLDTQVAHFASCGPKSCRGCSTTASGFSNTILRGQEPEPWMY